MLFFIAIDKANLVFPFFLACYKALSARLNASSISSFSKYCVNPRETVMLLFLLAFELSHRFIY